MHKTVRKWYQQQSALLAHEADSVRNSSLQQLFALRRSLELAAIAPHDHAPEQYQTWIQQLESLQASLNGFMDRLIPPFAEESLPLAIAAHLKASTGDDKGFQFVIQRTEDWGISDPLHINKAILAFFQGLDSDIGAAGRVASMHLAFSRTKSHKHVLITLRCACKDTATLQTKIHDLCRMVVFLSPIDYHLALEGRNLSLSFRWSTVETT
ncbi:MAG: hypothetical protein AAFW75_19070 [Cyanobacteria bacterium J06636_16]